jgi:hypothetical protein
MTFDPTTLPAGLPEPSDDGTAAHQNEMERTIKREKSRLLRDKG